MSLLKQHREEFLAMAVGEVDETRRQKLQKLIESDLECRDYWNEISHLTNALSGDAASADGRKPSAWLHARVRSTILGELKEGELGVGRRPWNLIQSWRIALAVPVAVFLVWWGISMVTNNSMAPEPKKGLSGHTGEAGIATPVALRQAVDGSSVSLDELLGDVLHPSVPTKKLVIYRASDGRTAELPSDEVGSDFFRIN